MSKEVEGSAIFTLQRVRLAKTGGLDITYSLSEVKNGVTNHHKYMVSDTRNPHGDLMSLLDGLKPLVASVFGVAQIWTMSEDSAFDGTNEQKGMLKALYVDEVEAFRVIGITIGGKEGNEGAILQCDYVTAAYQHTKIATPKLKFDANAYGFEEDLRKIVGCIEDEVYQYIFDDKTAEEESFMPSQHD